MNWESIISVQIVTLNCKYFKRVIKDEEELLYHIKTCI